MTSEKRDFNKDAATWDENPGRVKMADSVINAIKNNLRLANDMDVLDFGCGTGLISLRILPHVNTVTAADSSTGMLEVLNTKIANQNLTGIKTVHINIDNGEKLTGTYDTVTSSMTMHHIQNPAPLLKEFHEIIKPGGHLCIADLDPDGGLFHENNDGVFHYGFMRDEMKKLFSEAGFTEIKDVTAAEISKPGAEGTMNNFSIFLIIGKKL